jgi:phage I-like protein
VTPNSVSLRTTAGQASPARGADALPERLKLLAWGANDSIYGTITLDAESVAAFAAKQRSIGRERIALDFEHNTVEGTPEWQNSEEPRKIAAQGTPVLVPGEGLFLENLTWTETGRASAKDFEDLSPAVFLDGEGRVLAIHSAALTRTGAVHGLTVQPLSSSLARELTTLSAGIPATTTPTKSMDEPKPAAAPDMADIIKRIEALEGLINSLKAPTDAGEIKALSAQVAELVTARKAAEATTEQTQRENLIAQASREGKVIPLSAAALAITPLLVLTDLVGQLKPGVVPLSATAKPAGAPSTFSAAVTDKMKAGLSKAKAVAVCVAEMPDAYKDWLKNDGKI